MRRRPLASWEWRMAETMWHQNYDTFAIAAHFNVPECWIYNYLPKYRMMYRGQRRRKTAA